MHPVIAIYVGHAFCNFWESIYSFHAYFSSMHTSTPRTVAI